MAKRGRKSTASLATVTKESLIEAIPRPDAPYDLTDEQSEEWRAVVNRLPAEWFPRETWALLSQYCRHIVNARRVAQLVGQAEHRKNLDVAEYDKLLAMQEREGRAICALARAMRLTQQTSYDKSKKKPLQVRKPWEAD